MIRMILLILCLIVLLFVIYCILPTVYYLHIKKAPFSSAVNKKKIILSFDDGPDMRYTPELLDKLDKNNVRAVFFVVAEKARENPDLIRQISERGHMIGFHSLEHRDVWRKSPFYQVREFKSGLEILRTMGCKVSYYRAPWGHLNLISLLLSKKYGLGIILWTVMAQDWEKDSTALRVTERLRRRIGKGGVICLHDSGCGKGAAEGAPAHTVRAVSMFLPALIDEGFEFVLPN